VAPRRLRRAVERLRRTGHVGEPRVLRRVSQHRAPAKPHASATRLLRVAHLSAQRQRKGCPVRAHRLGEAMRLRFHALVLILFTAFTIQAQRLPRTVTPQHYDLTFAPNLSAETFDGDETIEVTNELSTTSIKLHAMEITFSEVSIESHGVKQTASVTPNTADEMVTLTV